MMTIERFRFGDWVSSEARTTFASAIESAPPVGDIEAVRRHYDAFNRERLDEALDAYPVEIESSTLAGVDCHVVEPEGGATDPRVLISLHGGAFMWGSGAGAILEAVPVSAVTGMKVVAVEYRLAPEHLFPVAVDDVLAVYRALADEMPAASIGMYGCSAGASLVAQAIARMIAEGTRLPGAVAMFHAAGLELQGDSILTSALFQPTETESPTFETLPYFATTSPGNSLAVPGNHPEILAKFPPALLISGTRDFASSSVSVMHRRLLAQGVDAQFILFDGMWHAHHMFTTLPEARETFAAIAGFFDRTLR